MRTQEDLDSRQQSLELPLDCGRLVLPRRPCVRDKGVILLLATQRELRRRVCPLEPNCLHEGVAPQRDRHRDQHDDQHSKDEEEKHRGQGVRRLEAEDGARDLWRAECCCGCAKILK
eukprot:2749281-Prymnesium_polylepis.1